MKSHRGFTLIELLVVVAIIALLASIVLSSLGEAREKAKYANAAVELRDVRRLIEIMEQDTGKWPGGCPPSKIVRNYDEFLLNDVKLEYPYDNTDYYAGLVRRPPFTATNGDCKWTAEDEKNYRGFYTTKEGTTDPWGRGYYFDADYCIDEGSGSKQIIAIISLGPDGKEGYGDKCSIPSGNNFLTTNEDDIAIDMLTGEILPPLE